MDDKSIVRLLGVMANAGITEHTAALGILVNRYHDTTMPDEACDLLEPAERDPSTTFATVASGLDEPGPGGKLLLSFWFHRESFEWPSAEVLEWVGDDERRARAAAGLVRAEGERVPALIRELIRRFGAHGSVAREIRKRLMSTDGLVASLAEHDQQRLGVASAWVEDPDPAVAAFAEVLVEELERSYEVHAAQEEDERRRYGT